MMDIFKYISSSTVDEFPYPSFNSWISSKAFFKPPETELFAVAHAFLDLFKLGLHCKRKYKSLKTSQRPQKPLMELGLITGA